MICVAISAPVNDHREASDDIANDAFNVVASSLTSRRQRWQEASC